MRLCGNTKGRKKPCSLNINVPQTNHRIQSFCSLLISDAIYPVSSRNSVRTPTPHIYIHTTLIKPLVILILRIPDIAISAPLPVAIPRFALLIDLEPCFSISCTRGDLRLYLPLQLWLYILCHRRLEGLPNSIFNLYIRIQVFYPLILRSIILFPGIVSYIP